MQQEKHGMLKQHVYKGKTLICRPILHTYCHKLALMPSIPSVNIKHMLVLFTYLYYIQKLRAEFTNRTNMDYILVLHLNIIQCHLFYINLEEVLGFLLTK